MNNHVFHNPKNQRIDFLDQRFYTRDGITFYPSVTEILNCWPKGPAYHQWLKDLGNRADDVMRRAADKGSKIHDAIERYLNDEELTFADDSGRAQYEWDEWEMLLRFQSFWRIASPELLGTEINMISDTYRLGGTLDIICRIGGELWLIDTKTGNAIYDTHALQLAAYAMMWNDMNPENPVQRVGIMHLRALTKGPARNGKGFQGAGWKLHEFDESIEHNWKSFCDIRSVWDRINPDYKPRNLQVPDRISLKSDLIIASPIAEGILVEPG